MRGLSIAVESKADTGSRGFLREFHIHILTASFISPITGHIGTRLKGIVEGRARVTDPDTVLVDLDKRKFCILRRIRERKADRECPRRSLMVSLRLVLSNTVGADKCSCLKVLNPLSILIVLQCENCSISRGFYPDILGGIQYDFRSAAFCLRRSRNCGGSGRRSIRPRFRQGSFTGRNAAFCLRGRCCGNIGHRRCRGILFRRLAVKEHKRKTSQQKHNKHNNKNNPPIMRTAEGLLV